MRRSISLTLVAVSLGGPLVAVSLGGPLVAQSADPEPRLLNPDEVEAAIRDNYPLPLWDIRASGYPVLRIEVDAEGRVEGIEVLDAGGHRMFANAAEAVARAMRFAPAVVDGETAPSRIEVPIGFETPLPAELAELRVCESPPVLINQGEIVDALKEFYPEQLRSAGIAGRVVLLLKIDSRGTVWSIEVEQGSGILALDEAALAVGAFMRFAPGTEDGAPTPSLLRQAVTFERRSD